MRIRNKWLYALASLMAVVITPRAHASYIGMDAYSISAYTGTETFDASGDTGTITATVDYAVFAPGVFPGPANSMSTPNPITGTDAAPMDYVYCYVVNNQPNPPSSTDLNISSASVGLATGSGATLDTHNESLGGTAPALQQLNPNSFMNIFATPGLAPGSSSDILIFYSPLPPTFASSSVVNGGVNDQAFLPSPAVPEPGSIALLALGGLMTLRRRRAHN